jgi:catechol 2,3-dioxygenase-like lactoylglutathione lyase family enzyme
VIIREDHGMTARRPDIWGGRAAGRAGGAAVLLSASSSGPARMRLCLRTSRAAIAAMVGQVIGAAHLILYVRDQAAATAFWQAVLDRQPDLNEPGMTEFALGAQTVLGLMPEAGIRSLLGPSLPDPAAAGGIPRAEVYLVVSDSAAYHARALAAGAIELSPLAQRSWGDHVAYSLDMDGHVLAVATKPTRVIMAD